MSAAIPIPPRVGDVGTAIEIAVTEQDPLGVSSAVNLAAATAMIIRFQKPDGTAVVKTAVLSTDGTDGLMRYTVVAGDLDQAGTWQVEGRVSIGGGQWSTEIYKMKVGPILG